jgi:hypothetical protein
MKYCLKFLMLLTFCLAFETLHAQTVLRGTVVDNEGMPVSFATITSSRRNAVSAGEDGRFEIQVSKKVRTVDVSAAGYSSVEIPVDPQPDSIRVTLQRVNS